MEGQCHQGKACEVHPSRDGSMDRNAMFCFFCGVFLAESCSLQDVSSLITKQMLTFYSADSNQGRELTRLWDRIMIEVGEGLQCWGVGGGSWALTTEVVRAPMMPTGG